MTQKNGDTLKLANGSTIFLASGKKDTIPFRGSDRRHMVYDGPGDATGPGCMRCKKCDKIFFAWLDAEDNVDEISDYEKAGYEVQVYQPIKAGSISDWCSCPKGD